MASVEAILARPLTAQEDPSPVESPRRPRDKVASCATARPQVCGKFLFLGHEKFYVRGVTYGSFRPDANGNAYPAPDQVARDFAAMAFRGINAVRTYTVPPIWLLDLALTHGLRVMVGLPWEQHICFLADRARAKSIEQRIRAGVQACIRHPAILCYAIGNEIPAPVVRWYGRRRVERFLEQLYRAAKEEDPEGLVTYVNYPSTEYLRLPFLDLVSFNVYLESQRALSGYVARLHNLGGTRPLLLAEIGLDSRRNGLEAQSRTLNWQVRTAFASGCAGVFVFAWTDEWYRGGCEILDWDFGLTQRDGRPKPALDSVQEAFAATPFAASDPWPRISVVVCTYNGSRTLRDCLGGVRQLRYSNYEVIVMNDGSTDQSAVIAAEFGVRLISTENCGLSAARNAGMEHARGDIVAYLDDDARPDPDWLTFLAATFRTTAHVAVGGPNIAPPGDGPIADCVVNAPGGPLHVLFNDTDAEHIPGCNFAIRRSCLQDLGGFDPTFRAAGDDVDLCWRILQRGWTIGFNPAAVVWHHRRNSIRTYWRQQRGYGKAEALLERKWPEKYNTVGHIKWGGSLYGPGLTRLLFRTQRVYHGSWGSAAYQALHQSAPNLFTVLPTMPEWYLVVIFLAGLSAMALLWPKLLVAVPLLLLAGGATIWQAILSGAQASFPVTQRSKWARFNLHVLTVFLHLLQPLARLSGRVRHGLTAWRWRMPRVFLVPRSREAVLWSDQWRSPESILQTLEKDLRKQGAVLLVGGAYDRWDLEVRGGLLGAARLFMVVEDHGASRQLFRFRYWPRFSWEGLVGILVFVALSLGAAVDQYWLAYDLLTLLTVGFISRTLYESGASVASLRRVIEQQSGAKP